MFILRNKYSMCYSYIINYAHSLFIISEQLCNSSCHGHCILLYNVDNNTIRAPNEKVNYLFFFLIKKDITVLTETNLSK